IAVVIALLSVPAAAQDWSAQKEARVDALIQHFLQRRNGAVTVPALSIAIGIDGERVLAKGYGPSRHGVPADENTVYHIGSLTKQFTAAAMLRLIAEHVRAPLTGEPLALDT